MQSDKKYSYVIIDDEAAQRLWMKRNLDERHPELIYAGESGTIDGAVQLIQSKKPDLVFLDIQIPPGTGFDIIKQCEGYRFDIIFATSFEQYAIHAIKVAAIDYLLKPFTPEDLSAAVERFLLKRSEPYTIGHVEALLENLRRERSDRGRIAIPSTKGFVFLDSSQIIRCSADNNYTICHLNDGQQLLVSRTLGDFEDLLAPYGFLRIHASHLINLEYVSEYIRGDAGQIRMRDNSVVDLSRRRKEEFLSRIGKL